MEYETTTFDRAMLTYDENAHKNKFPLFILLLSKQ